MIGRRLGLVLVLTLSVAVTAGALIEGFRLDDRISRERASGDLLNQKQQTAHLALAKLRGAQAAYFAAGQGPAFWQSRASELAAGLEQDLTDLQGAASSDAGRAHFEAALAALGGLNSLDQKARDDLAQGSTGIAADVVFSDATASAAQLESELAAGRTEEAAGREARLGQLQSWRLRAQAAGFGVLLLAVFALAVGRRQPARTAAVAPPLVQPTARLAPSPVAPARPAPRPAARIDVGDAAQVCVDLARVLDSEDIPPLLKRAATVLGAKGLVLWVADTSGAVLRASLAHGYPDRVLHRLGPLAVDADNVTSLAFRSMQAQTLTGTARGATNAIAVPLISATGCTGVLAAEVAEDGARPETVAVARIFAAQLATLVTSSDPTLERPAPAAEPAAGL
jgi:hypothetical protein